MAGVVEDGKDQRGWKARIVHDGGKGPWLREEVEWAFALAEQPDLFRMALRKVVPDTTAGKSNANRVRRLLSLVKSPTSKKFSNLLADERKADVLGLKILTSALRFAAGRTIYVDRSLPKNWVYQVKKHPDQIGLVASKAHEFLKRGLHGQGRAPTSPDLERYAEQVAAAYLSLTGRAIEYARATGNVRRRTAGESYGQGLEFMLLAFRMVDGATEANQARWQIDRIRPRNAAETK